MVRSARLTTIACCGALLTSGCVRQCNDIGCIDGVTIDLVGMFDVTLLPLVVTTCADDVCSTERIEHSVVEPGATAVGIAPAVVLDEPGEREVTVTVEVRSDATGATVFAATGTAHLRRSQPNGPSCPDTCYGASVRYDAATDRLVEG